MIEKKESSHNKLNYSSSLGRSGIERLDLLLLAMESLDIKFSENLSIESQTHNLKHYFPNRVELWKYRAHNPMRKTYITGKLSKDTFDALTLLLSQMSNKHYPLIRQFLSSKEPIEISIARWNNFRTRFNSLISERMNIRRGAVKKYLDHQATDSFYKQLIVTLALSSGNGGLQRLRASLSDLTF